MSDPKRMIGRGTSIGTTELFQLNAVLFHSDACIKLTEQKNEQASYERQSHKNVKVLATIIFFKVMSSANLLSLH